MHTNPNLSCPVVAPGWWSEKARFPTKGPSPGSGAGRVGVGVGALDVGGVDGAVHVLRGGSESHARVKEPRRCSTSRSRPEDNNRKGNLKLKLQGNVLDDTRYYDDEKDNQV